MSRFCLKHWKVLLAASASISSINFFVQHNSNVECRQIFRVHAADYVRFIENDENIQSMGWFDFFLGTSKCIESIVSCSRNWTSKEKNLRWRWRWRRWRWWTGRIQQRRNDERTGGQCSWTTFSRICFGRVQWWNLYGKNETFRFYFPTNCLMVFLSVSDTRRFSWISRCWKTKT